MANYIILDSTQCLPRIVVVTAQLPRTVPQCLKPRLNLTIGAGGTGLFAGILVNPKAFAVSNIESNSDTVPDGTAVEVMREGECYVLLTVGTGVTIGDGVFFVNATGALGAGTAAAGQTQIVGASVFRHNPSAANSPSLATIRIKA